MLVSKPENCGNAPKNAFVEDLVFQIFTGASYQEKLAPDCKVEIHGLGADSCLENLGTILGTVHGVTEVRILDAISHGRKGAVDLELLPGSGMVLHLAVFVLFASLKGDLVASIKVLCAGLQP